MNKIKNLDADLSAKLKSNKEKKEMNKDNCLLTKEKALSVEEKAQILYQAEESIKELQTLDEDQLEMMEFLMKFESLRRGYMNKRFDELETRLEEENIGITEAICIEIKKQKIEKQDYDFVCLGGISFLHLVAHFQKALWTAGSTEPKKDIRDKLKLELDQYTNCFEDIAYKSEKIINRKNYSTEDILETTDVYEELLKVLSKTTSFFLKNSKSAKEYLIDFDIMKGINYLEDILTDIKTLRLLYL